jgi:DNA-binding phage protein
MLEETLLDYAWFDQIGEKSLVGQSLVLIAALKQVEAERAVEDVAREVGVSKHTIYGWKAKYGGMDVSQAQEAK